MNKELELKPCPFCGSEAELSNFKTSSDTQYYYISCSASLNHCMIESHYTDISKEELIEKWNTRVNWDNLNNKLHKEENQNIAMKSYLQGLGMTINEFDEIVPVLYNEEDYRAVFSWRRYCTSGELENGKPRIDFKNYSLGFKDGLIAGKAECKGE